MSTQKRSRVSNRRRGSLSQLRHFPKHFMAWLLRLIFIGGRFSRTSQAGFVLPTTVLLILVLTLTVGGLSFRSFSRVGQTIAYREQQRIDNFAAPAIDRAKAKIEYLFTKDKVIIDKRPPSSKFLVQALLAESKGAAWEAPNHSENDPYTLPDEQQLDINGDGLADPAWSFEADGNTVVYSLLVSHDSRDQEGEQDDVDGAVVSFDSNDTARKAKGLVVRNGPINTARSTADCPISAFAGDGWQDTIGNLQKNFQVNVLSVSNVDGPNRTVSAAEYQQVRSSPKGNKYGAWFRYDLEIFPGAAFRWNGAMHSESNIISGANLEAYLVSSPNSCIFSDDASEITISESSYDLDGDGSTDETFTGHIVSGASRDDSFGRITGNGGGRVLVHDFIGGAPRNNVRLDETTHSIIEGGGLTGIAVDPVLIFTEDRTDNLNDPGAGSWRPDPARVPNLLQGSDRVLQFPDAARPFVDDGYRADNRYGPKPRYDALNSLTQANSARDNVSHNIGDPINDNPLLSTNVPDEQEFGLDGYWERRAVTQGLRVVVGQRLELGNRFGWEADDPLYPPTQVDVLQGRRGQPKGPAEAKQQKSLRDNLSAVQGMVAYHYSIDNGQVPYICMASTVHPGTEQTLINSRTFGTYPETGATRIDFLTGNGTNGWEFDFQGKYTDASAFATAIAPNQPLGRAIRNLARFAGDPQGGAPSFPPVQGISGDLVGDVLEPNDDFVHPYPYLSMWGDFSVLRRILFSHSYTNALETDLVDTADKYNALSPADKSTLHSAACSLGMLASNLEQLEAEHNTILLNNAALVTDIASRLTAASVADGDQAERWIDALETSGLTGDDLERAKLLALYRQVQRDRLNGFEVGPNARCVATAEFPQPLVDAFCSTAQLPAFPSLYYVFPIADHNQDGSRVATVPGTAPVAGAATQAGEYIDEGAVTNKYIFDPDGARVRVNDAVLYNVVDPADADITDLSDVALTPKAIGNFNQPTASVAALPDPRDELQKSTIRVGATTYELAFLDKAMMDGRELLNVRVLDLDIDKLTLINTLDNKTFFTVGTDNVAWIPEVEGVFYAAREDAVREDNIARPRQAASDWNTCRVFANLLNFTTGCTMKVDNPTSANQLGTYDPPLSADNLISPKPVDMYADPDRRPYGFRLINGSVIHRSTSDEAAGLTFVTDNPAYVYGDFNLHQDTLGNILEEFTEQLGIDFALGNGDPFNDFYNRATLDPNFARGGLDLWRPSEIFADAVTILSAEFRDGFVEDGYIYETDDMTLASHPSSYLNSNRPLIGTRKVPADWKREDKEAKPNDSDSTLPMLFDRNGLASQTPNRGANADFQLFPGPYGGVDNFDGRHIVFNEGDYVDDRLDNQTRAADTTRVNALLIAGIVPLRSGQNYGGLHNFPRLVEYWDQKSLIISGGFFQLNFSTHSTAPFDQDAWETNNAGAATIPNQGAVKNKFYEAARRIWGYDVGFQYTSVAPIARRFVSFGRPRSEYYSELALNDPYIDNLCRATNSAGDFVLTDAADNSACQ